MSTETRLINLSTAIREMLDNHPEETAIPGLLAGALYALHKAYRINAQLQVTSVAGPEYLTELRAVLASIDKPDALRGISGLRDGAPTKGSWLMGYYMSDAAFRVHAAWDRVGYLISPGPGKCPVGYEMNDLKHGMTSKTIPVTRSAVTVDFLLDTINDLLGHCSRIIRRSKP
jgi:hypothetical protein